MSEDDPVLKRLADLPQIAPDELHKERVRRRAQAALAAERSLLSRLWSRAVVPAFCVGATAIYLVWAISFTANLYK
jgi:hypothetical protein